MRLSTASRPRLLVSWILDLLRARVSDQDLARAVLSPRTFRFVIRYASGSALAIQKTFSLGLLLDLRRALRAMVHRDRKTFPGVFTAASPGRMAWSFAFVFKRSRKRQRRSGFPIYLDASRLAVPVVTRGDSRRDHLLEENHPPARARVWRSTSVVLDGRCISSAPAHRSASGLLFDEHVERVRDLLRDRMGPVIATLASAWRGICRTDRNRRGTDDAFATDRLASQRGL